VFPSHQLNAIVSYGLKFEITKTNSGLPGLTIKWDNAKPEQEMPETPEKKAEFVLQVVKDLHGLLTDCNAFYLKEFMCHHMWEPVDGYSEIGCGHYPERPYEKGE
jgi:hypothetical protein